MPQTAKKPWVEPELLVVVRNHPEEAVLDNCKDGSVAGSGPTTTDSACSFGDGCISACIGVTPS